MTERVKAVKAKRSGGKAISEQIVEEIPLEVVRERDPGPSKRDIEFNHFETSRLIEPGRNHAAAARMSAERPITGNESETAQAPKTGGRANDQIVEAALLRARRASENASRVVLPADPPSQPTPSTSKTPLAVDKEATAKAIEVSEKVKPRSEVAHSPVTQFTRQAEAAPAPEKDVSPQRNHMPPVKVETRSNHTPLDVATNDLPFVLPIDDIEPRDYLAAEIKKVDRELNEQFAHNESPPLFAHIVLNVADFITISLASAPFLALIEIYSGSFIERPTQISGVCLVAVVTFFYLALTQGLCGKTFGMMLTNTRIVDARTFESPSSSRAMVRSAGYFLATLPALIGFIWLLFNRKRRGWHDYISGTMVARDF